MLEMGDQNDLVNAEVVVDAIRCSKSEHLPQLSSMGSHRLVHPHVQTCLLLPNRHSVILHVKLP